MRAVISTSGLDRHGDVVEQDGLEFDNFLQSGSVLFNHDKNCPVAKPIEIMRMGDSTEALVEFPPEGTSAMSDEVCRLVKTGVINAVSVSFLPKQGEPLEAGGTRFRRAELIEFSFVTVPANVDALVLERSMSQAQPKDSQDSRRFLLGAIKQVGRRAPAPATEQITPKGLLTELMRLGLLRAKAAPDELDVGDFVRWDSGGGVAQGRIERVERDGQISVPDSDFVITGQPDDPAALIVVYAEDDGGWEPTDVRAGHRFSTLTKINPLPPPMEEDGMSDPAERGNAKPDEKRMSPKQQQAIRRSAAVAAGLTARSADASGPSARPSPSALAHQQKEVDVVASVAELRQRRIGLANELSALSEPKDTQGAPRAWTEADSKAFDAKEAEYRTLDEQLQRAEKALAATKASAVPLAIDDPSITPAQPRTPQMKGAGFARIVKAPAAEQGNRRNAAQYATDQPWQDKDAIAKALGSSTAGAGGFLVPEEFSNDIIELLRAKAVVFMAGPEVMPMNGTMLLPKITTGANGQYIGENTNAPKEEQTFGQLRLTSKKLASLVPISNDLIRNSAASADRMVRDDMVAGLAVTADAALLRDQGTGAAPKGFRFWAPKGNITASNGTNATQVELDIQQLVGGLQDNNIPMIRPAWFMAPRSHRFLYNLRDANGNLIYPELRQITDAAPMGMLYGFPVFATTNIPTNLNGNQSEIYLVDMAQVVIGEETGVEIMVSDTAAYHDGTGVVAAFSQDQTVIRAIMRHDMVLRHEAAVAVKTGITYGSV
ncbi:MAG: phage major capsid protein [Pseudomonadota bacterium]